jgi:hypothetical protein
MDDRNKAYGIVASEFIQTINTVEDNAEIMSDYMNKEELIDDLWHCVALMEKIKKMFDN